MLQSSPELVTSPELDKTVKDDIESNKIKPRKHPGVMKIGSCSLPTNIIKAIEIVSEGMFKITTVYSFIHLFNKNM